MQIAWRSVLPIETQTPGPKALLRDHFSSSISSSCWRSCRCSSRIHSRRMHLSMKTQASTIQVREELWQWQPETCQCHIRIIWIPNATYHFPTINQSFLQRATDLVGLPLESAAAPLVVVGSSSGAASPKKLKSFVCFSIVHSSHTKVTKDQSSTKVGEESLKLKALTPHLTCASWGAAVSWVVPVAAASRCCT